MKLLSLEISRLKNYLANNTLIFLVYMVGSIACILTFIYFYGNGVAYKVNSAKNDILYRTYTVNFTSPANIDIDTIQKILTDKGDIISFQHTISVSNVSGENIMGGQNISEYYLMAYYRDNFEISLKRGKKAFNTDGKQVIVPSEFLSSGADLAYININDTELDIIGESYLNDTFIIPYDFFYGRYSVDVINILLHDKPTTEENKSYVSMLSKMFPNVMISDPSVYYTSDTADSVSNIAYLCVMFLICFFTFSLLMKYIIEVNNRENIICIIVGARRRTTAALMILDNLTVISVSLICAITLHIILYNSLFQNINIYGGIVYTLFDYIIIAAVILVISEIPMLFIIRKYYCQSAVKSSVDYA